MAGFASGRVEVAAGRSRHLPVLTAGADIVHAGTTVLTGRGALLAANVERPAQSQCQNRTRAPKTATYRPLATIRGLCAARIHAARPRDPGCGTAHA